MSVFGLAPIPILIELGRLISDISDTTIFMRHREPSPTWAWPNDRVPLIFQANAGASKTRTVALKLSVSVEVSDERVRAAIGEEASIWEIKASEPGTTVACATEFGRVWQPKAHPPFTIYDQPAGKGFVEKHRIAAEQRKFWNRTLMPPAAKVRPTPDPRMAVRRTDRPYTRTAGIRGNDKQTILGEPEG